MASGPVPPGPCARDRDARRTVLWRLTFIHVQDEPVTVARPRVVSAPPQVGRPAAGVERAFEGDLAYVADLSERVDALWAGTAGRSRAKFGQAELTAAAHGGGAPSPGGSKAILHAQADAAAVGAADAAAVAPAGGSRMSAGNRGSLGHPEACNRPCIYFATNRCANGSECEFCHVPHPRRSSRLDRERREFLQTLPHSTARALLLFFVRARMYANGWHRDCEAAFARLVAACGETASTIRCAASQVRRSRCGRDLIGVLRSLSLRSLLSTLQSSVLDGELDADSAASALLYVARDAASSHAALSTLQATPAAI